MRHFEFLYDSRGDRRHRPQRSSAAGRGAVALPLAAALLPVLAAAPLTAQFHAAGGVGAIHDGDRGPAVEVGIRTALDAAGVVTAGGSLLAGSAGEGFVSAEAAAELRLDRHALLAPFVGLRAGVLIAPDASRGVVGALIGLAPRIGPGRRLRLAAGWSRRDGGGGPRVLLLGLEFGTP